MPVLSTNTYVMAIDTIGPVVNSQVKCFWYRVPISGIQGQALKMISINQAARPEDGNGIGQQTFSIVNSPRRDAGAAAQVGGLRKN
jgi:hypothetical protein